MNNGKEQCNGQISLSVLTGKLYWWIYWWLSTQKEDEKLSKSIKRFSINKLELTLKSQKNNIKITPEAHSEFNQASKKEFFEKIINDPNDPIQTIFSKTSIPNVFTRLEKMISYNLAKIFNSQRNDVLSL